VRSILFRLAKDEYVIVLIAGPAQASWPALRRALVQSRRPWPARPRSCRLLDTRWVRYLRSGCPRGCASWSTGACLNRMRFPSDQAFATPRS
jgi:hypothetical protein